MDSKIVGVKNNKAKSRRQSKNKANGKYKAQFVITEVNRKRKQERHQRKVEKKASKRMSFSFLNDIMELTPRRLTIVKPVSVTIVHYNSGYRPLTARNGRKPFIREHPPRALWACQRSITML